MTPTQTLLALIAGLAGLGFLAWLRWQDMQAWSRSLVRYKLSLPRDLTVNEVASWLGQLSAITVPGRWSLLPPVPVGLEIEATSHGITHFALVPEVREAAVLASLRAALPRVRVELAEGASEPPAFQAAAELRLTNMWTSLAEDRVESVATAQLAALQPLPSGAVVRVQWLLVGARIPRAALDPDVPDQVVGVRWRQSDPVLSAVCRIGVATNNRRRARAVLRRVWAALRGLNLPDTRITRRWLLPSMTVVARLTYRTIPMLIWPVTITSREVAGLLGLAIGPMMLPGVSAGIAAALPPSPIMPTTGLVVARATDVSPVLINSRQGGARLSRAITSRKTMPQRSSKRRANASRSTFSVVAANSVHRPLEERGRARSPFSPSRRFASLSDRSGVGDRRRLRRVALADRRKAAPGREGFARTAALFERPLDALDLGTRNAGRRGLRAPPLGTLGRRLPRRREARAGCAAVARAPLGAAPHGSTRRDPRRPFHLRLRRRTVRVAGRGRRAPRRAPQGRRRRCGRGRCIRPAADCGCAPPRRDRAFLALGLVTPRCAIAADRCAILS